MSDQQKIKTALSQGRSGITLSDQAMGDLIAAARGGEATTTFFRRLDTNAGFMRFLKEQGDAAWIESEDDAGNPVIFAAQESSANKLTLVLRPVAAPGVLAGTAAPEKFPWNGKNYNIVGSISGTFAYDEQPVWYVQVPVGVIELYPIAQLGKLAWPSFIKPVLTGVWNGFKSCFGSAVNASEASSLGESASGAAEQATVEGAEVGGEELSMACGAPAFGALALLVAVPFVIQAISHPTRHRLKIYNLTPYDITWAPPVMKHGAMNLAPVMSSDSEDYELEIPAMSDLSPAPGIKPVKVAHDAEFLFTSSSGLSGVGWMMRFALTDPAAADATVASAVASFWVPWGTTNCLYGAFGDFQDDAALDDVWSRTTNTLTAYGATAKTADGKSIKMSMSYDALNGQHQDMSGENSYFYTSMIVFSME